MQPMRAYNFHVYILASRSRTLYIGVTNNLWHRVLQHRERVGSTFTSKYRVTRLVHFEPLQYIQHAIAREKELKHWRRERKIALIESANPSWTDLAEGWSRQLETLQYDWQRESDRD